MPEWAAAVQESLVTLPCPSLAATREAHMCFGKAASWMSRIQAAWATWSADSCNPVSMRHRELKLMCAGRPLLTPGVASN